MKIYIQQEDELVVEIYSMEKEPHCRFGFLSLRYDVESNILKVSLQPFSEALKLFQECLQTAELSGPWKDMKFEDDDVRKLRELFLAKAAKRFGRLTCQMGGKGV